MHTAFPTEMEKAQKASRAFRKDTVPCSGSPGSLQSDNGPSFISKVTQQVAAAIGIYHLHTSWKPQSSGEVEKTNHGLKKILAKLCQEASQTRLKQLSTAFLRMKIAPKTALQLSPYETLYVLVKQCHLPKPILAY